MELRDRNARSLMLPWVIPTVVWTPCPRAATTPVHPTQTDIITVYARFGRSATHLFGSVSFDILRNEIDAGDGRPVEVCYAWTGGDSHVALVSGYSVDAAGSVFVKVNDPTDNIGLISFASLQTAYGWGRG